MNRISARALVAFLAVCAALLGGCAASRSEVRLGGLEAERAPAAAPARGTVVIASVRDERVFEQSPRDPSTPSLGGEGAAAASAELKARAIGRKRNTYGAAMGDVLLEPGQTVEKVVRDNLAAALRKAGYVVSEAPAPGAKSLDVRIRKFWSWFTPGFFSITLRTIIETQVRPSGGSPVDVNVLAETSHQFAGDAAWVEVTDKALQLYREQAAARLVELR